MPPRIGFALEQALGHVAYGLGLRHALAGREDFEPVWLEVPFGEHGFGRLPVVGRNWTLRGGARAARRIGAVRREAELDALFIHTQTISLFSGGHMAEVPTLLSFDATPLNYDEIGAWYGDKIHPAPVERAKLLAHRAVYRRARRVTAWSEWAKTSLVRDYGVEADRIVVLHPGTIIGNFPLLRERARSSERLRILFVGGDFKRKGGDLLLEVCSGARLRDRVELHLVTSADVTAQPNVNVYRGLKPHSAELLQRYAEADVFALPTRGDCLAVVLGEAMASGLPIVTTRVGAQPEAVEDGESGYVIEPNDAAALEDRLLRLADSRDLVERLGRRSRQIGEERFDMHKNAGAIAQILLELAGSGRAA